MDSWSVVVAKLELKKAISWRHWSGSKELALAIGRVDAAEETCTEQNVLACWLTVVAYILDDQQDNHEACNICQLCAP